MMRDYRHPHKSHSTRITYSSISRKQFLFRVIFSPVNIKLSFITFIIDQIMALPYFEKKEVIKFICVENS